LDRRRQTFEHNRHPYVTGLPNQQKRQPGLKGADQESYQLPYAARHDREPIGIHRMEYFVKPRGVAPDLLPATERPDHALHEREGRSPPSFDNEHEQGNGNHADHETYRNYSNGWSYRGVAGK
jgi:hypothetical protein